MTGASKYQGNYVMVLGPGDCDGNTYNWQSGTPIVTMQVNAAGQVLFWEAAGEMLDIKDAQLDAQGGFDTGVDDIDGERFSGKFTDSGIAGTAQLPGYEKLCNYTWTATPGQAKAYQGTANTRCWFTGEDPSDITDEFTPPVAWVLGPTGALGLDSDNGTELSFSAIGEPFGAAVVDAQGAFQRTTPACQYSGSFTATSASGNFKCINPLDRTCEGTWTANLYSTKP